MLRSVNTLDLSVLLSRLREEEALVLGQIDADPLLKKRERADGLVIANAGLALGEPEHEHQLFAKGIVYRRAPRYELISLPLVKMYNHGLRPVSDQTSRELEAAPDVRVVFPEKLDGTMLQLFAWEGQVWLTTRSVLEGTSDDEESEFIVIARRILTERHAAMLEASRVAQKSLIFELIHPKTRQVTRYGAQERMVLIAVFDHQTWCYWPQQRVMHFAEEHRLEVAQPILEDDHVARGVERLHAQLQADPELPEGSIVCFEREGQLVHRVKVKTRAYLEAFALRQSVSLSTVAAHLWDQPALHDWDSYLAHLRQKNLSEEEVEAFYRQYFEMFMTWHRAIVARHEALHTTYISWIERAGLPPSAEEDEAAHKGWFKALAIWARAHVPRDLFGLLMLRARRGELSVTQLMWHDPLCSGLRATLEAAGVRG